LPPFETHFWAAIALPSAITPAAAACAAVSLLFIAVTAVYLRLRWRYARLRFVMGTWRHSFDSLGDCVLVHTNDGRVQQINKNLATRLKIHPKQAYQQPCDQVLPRVQEGRGCPYCNLHESGVLEGEDPCFGGRSVVATSHFATVGRHQGGAIHIIHDISGQLLAEERYRRFCEGIHEAVFISTPDGCIVDCNDAFVKLVGLESRSEVLAMDAHSLYLSRAERDAFRRTIDQHGFVNNYEVCIQRHDGAVRTVRESSFATRDPQGNVVSYSGFLLDVTEQKHAEEELRRRNHELHVLNTIAGVTSRSFDLDEILDLCLRHLVELQNADHTAVCIYDPQRKVLALRASHIPAAEVAGNGKQPAREFLVSDEFIRDLAEQHVEVLNEAQLKSLPAELRRLLGVEPGSATICMVVWAQEKLGGLLALRSHTRNMYTPREEALMASIGRQLGATLARIRLYNEACHAYEDLRRTQEQLLQSEKMSAVGQLISGVAHELNNPLTAVLGYSQLLENEEMTPRARDFIAKIFRQAQRTHRVVQSLLSFARPRKPQKQRVDLRRVLEDTLLLRDYDLKLNNITVERTDDPDLPFVVADPHQLEQVFLNIVNNAADAILEMGHGGSLSVRTFAQDGRVCVEFRDSGPGLRDTKRIFDPFYTTKEVGKGTGLGLSICYGIIKEHHGEIVAFNHGDGGAAFQIRLPIAEVATETPKRASENDNHKVTLQAKILLVDDEESVLEFESEVLARAGAQVTALTDAQAAVEALRTNAFDLVLIDCKMPGSFSGVDFCRWVADHKPEMLRRVVMTVSDANDPELRTFLTTCSVRCLSKPFEVTTLLSACQQLLETPLAVASGA
jgi:PAS domain S-box-containing protein